MIDWKRGGWAGSVNRWVRREVREQLRENVAARRSRYGLVDRALHRFFAIGAFGRFVAGYVAINLAFVVAEAVAAWLVPSWLPAWTAPGPTPDLRALVLNVSSYLLGAQVGVLGVLSLALALITLIAQRESSSTDVKVYYHESLAFEIVASCVALMAVLCVQLLWPSQFLLHRLGFGTELLVFKFGLLGVHLAWLLLNLVGLAHFIITTFGFVQQSEREVLRERYTANIVHAREMTSRLRQQLYGVATTELISPDADEKGLPAATFGIDFGDPQTIEIQTTFQRPTALHDVRMIWVRWVLRRWAGRCVKRAASEARLPSHGLGQQGPQIWFTPHLDVPLRGSVGWCRRRGGVPLDALERLVLRRAFRFRRTGDEA